MKIKIGNSLYYKSFLLFLSGLFLGCYPNTLESNKPLESGDIVELTFEGPVSYSYQIASGENKTYQASDGDTIEIKTVAPSNPNPVGLVYFSFNPDKTPKIGMGADPAHVDPTSTNGYPLDVYRDQLTFSNETKGETLKDTTFINFTGKFLKARSMRKVGSPNEYSLDDLIAHAEDISKDNSIFSNAPITFKILGAAAPAPGPDEGQITTGGEEEAGKAGCMLYQGNAPSKPRGLAFMGLGLGILFSASLRISFVLLRSALR